MRIVKRPATNKRGLRHTGDDRGSIIVAMTVVLILFLIATATLARVMDGLTVAVKNRAYSSALGLADGGLSDALFRIDQQTAATSSFCVGPSPTCTLSAVPALPGIQYRAIVPDYPKSDTPNPDEFIVQSEGSVNGQLHALQALVQRNEAAPFAAFAVNGITLNGHGGNTTIDSNPPGNPAPIGSDGSIICHGDGNDGTSQQVYGGGSDNCPVPVHPPGSYDPAPPTLQCAPSFTYMDPCAWGTSSSSTSTGTWTPTETYVSDGTSNPEVVARTCPSGNQFGQPTQTTQYPTGVYVCFGDVTFAGTIDVTNVTSGTGSGVTSTDDGDADDGMQVFVFNTPSDPSPTVHMSGAVINPTQSSRDFHLYVAGTSPTIDPGNGSAAATVTGLIWAPTASLTVNGGSMTIEGSLVVGTLTINGNPNLHLTYDYGLTNLVQQNWQVDDYTEIPVRCFSDNPTDTVPLASGCPSI